MLWIRLRLLLYLVDVRCSSFRKLKSWHCVLCTSTNVNTHTSELQLYIAFSWFVVISSVANMRGNRSFSFSVNVVFNTSRLRGIIVSNDCRYKEICFIINNLKVNKAAGSDNIPAELLKHGGRALKQKVHKLILMMWIKNNYHNNGLKELSIQFIRKVIDLIVTTTHQLHY